jgi:hypothetical protein
MTMGPEPMIMTFLMSLRFGISVFFLHGEIDGSGTAFSRREYMKNELMCQLHFDYKMWGALPIIHGRGRARKLA